MSDYSRVRRAILAAGALIPFNAAFGQSTGFPTRPVRIVFPFPPGTANDVGLRLVAEKLSQKWGQPVIVENKPGASTILGTDSVAKSPKDGYTLLVNITLILQNTALGRKLPYDLQRDLTPIAQIARAQLAVLARSDLPANNLTELYALTRRQPGKLNFASFGLASTAHIAYEKMRLDQGLEFTHIPFKGGVEIITGLLNGEVQVGMADFLSPAPHIRSGKLKVLGVTGPVRRPDFPRAQTMTESGVNGFNGYNWLGLFGPSGMPQSIALQINEAVNEVTRDQSTTDRFTKELGLEMSGLSLAEWTNTVQRDLASWTAVARLAKMSVE